MRFGEEEEAYSIRIHFDNTNAWSLGEERDCELEFLHWEYFPKPFPTMSFRVFEIGEIGRGVFENSNSMT